MQDMDGHNSTKWTKCVFSWKNNKEAYLFLATNKNRTWTVKIGGRLTVRKEHGWQTKPATSYKDELWLTSYVHKLQQEYLPKNCNYMFPRWPSKLIVCSMFKNPHHCSNKEEKKCSDTPHMWSKWSQESPSIWLQFFLLEQPQLAPTLYMVE